MDSCLPVIHLIDTTRSIPYAIKQVQELIGISCAFEQAVKVPLNALTFFLQRGNALWDTLQNIVMNKHPGLLSIASLEY